MQRDYLYNHNDFADLINIVAEQMSILPNLVEKDYWIMHCLYGLQKLNLAFEVKGGTSLNKGHNIIKRSSEDIDIHIEPPEDMEVKIGKNHDKSAHLQSRKKFYDWLAQTIKIDGIVEQEKGSSPTDFMRHYYDVYCLLHSPIVQNFIGTEEYLAHKKKRFRSHDNLVIAENEAFLLSLPEIYQTYEQAYQGTSALYYESQPEFKKIMELFQKYLDKL